MRPFLFLLLFYPALTEAALEDWPCNWLADYYGYVAVDRDSGMSSKDRSNKVVRDIITVMDAESGIDVVAEDAQALLRVVTYVYLHKGTPYQIRREALIRCIRGETEPPLLKMRGRDA